MHPDLHQTACFLGSLSPSPKKKKPAQMLNVPPFSVCTVAYIDLKKSIHAITHKLSLINVTRREKHTRRFAKDRIWHYDTLKRCLIYNVEAPP